MDDNAQCMENPLWYKDAVIYELHIKAFFDSDNNGSRDFAGLIQKLDYLQNLGVNTLWLLPFYPSPMRDDGYDIADHHNIHPEYGSMADFKPFMIILQLSGGSKALIRFRKVGLPEPLRPSKKKFASADLQMQSAKDFMLLTRLLKAFA